MTAQIMQIMLALVASQWVWLLQCDVLSLDCWKAWLLEKWGGHRGLGALGPSQGLSLMVGSLDT